jgi:hypothetical protein
VKTIGIVAVADMAARAETLPPVATMTATQLCRHPGELIVLRLCPAKFDRDIPALGVANLLQALTKGSQLRRKTLGRCAVEESDHRN